MNILVSDASSYKSVVIAKYLKSNYNDIKVFTCDNRAYTRYFHTKYSDGHFILNYLDSREYIQQIIDLSEFLHIDFFLPVNSSEMDTVLKNKSKLGKLVDYWGAFEQFSILNEKDKLYNFAKERDILLPKKYQHLRDARVPFLLKPKISSSSKGVVYFFDKTQLNDFIKNRIDERKYIIQEYIAGKGVGYSVFAHHGRIIKGYGHLRLAEFPISGGSSVYRANFDHPDIRGIAHKLIKDTNWSGFAMFEFKLSDKDNRAYLIEVNPRIWGSINQGLQNGINFFEGLLGPADRRTETGNRKTYLSPLIFWSLLQYCLKGRFSYLLNFLNNFRDNVPDINIFNDSFAYFGLVLRLL